MSSLAIAGQKYESVSDKSLTQWEIAEPMWSTAAAAIGSTATVASAIINGLNPLTAGFALVAIAPVLKHGPRVYTQYIPENLKLIWGEVVRKITQSPNVQLGISGWEDNCCHSHHFDRPLAEALLGLCDRQGFDSAVEFSCGGRGELPQFLTRMEIPSDGYDFSKYSRIEYDLKNPGRYDINDSFRKRYSLVVSVDEVMSKMIRGQEEEFANQLVAAAYQLGLIVVSCATPDQGGPNINPMTTGKVKKLFTDRNCEFLQSVTNKLRRLAHPIHPWTRENLLVFRYVGNRS